MEYFLYTIINLVLFLLVQFVFSYFKEKGKNLATKEDVAKITQEIEAVKQVFINESIKLKADLDLLTNFKFSFVGEEKKALLKFNKHYSIWFTTISIEPVKAAYNYDNAGINELVKRIDLSFNKFTTAQFKLQFLIEDPEIKELSVRLVIEGMETFVAATHQFLEGIQQFNTSLESAKEESTEKSKMFQEFDSKVKIEMPRIKRILDEYHKRCREYLKEKMKQ